MSVAHRLRPAPSARPEGAEERSTRGRGVARLLLLGLTSLGCHVFTPGLAPRDGSAHSSPVGAGPVVDAARAEEAAPAGTQTPVYGQPSKMGCSDGTREGFRDPELWKDIAGCAGGWLQQGLVPPEGTAKARPCDGVAGNNSDSPKGILCPTSGGNCQKCGVADLCAPFWHPCKDGPEVSRRSPTGCAGILSPGELGFFLSLAGASEDGVCGPDQLNDLHGCGNLGQPESADCPPFTRRMGFTDCQASGGIWNCGNHEQNLKEREAVTKTSSELGGVLCCRN